jgi:hypothetical protein
MIMPRDETCEEWSGEPLLSSFSKLRELQAQFSDASSNLGDAWGSLERMLHETENGPLQDPLKEPRAIEEKVKPLDWKKQQ